MSSSNYLAAQWQFEENDTVAILSKSGGLRIGLVSETHESDDISSSSDEDDDEKETKLKPGQLRCEWYPTGKQSTVSSNRVFLLDRSLLLGEMACRRTQSNRIGTVRNMKLQADFLLLPQCEYVIRNVTDDRIEFVSNFDDASTSCYVYYDNWAGTLTESSDKLLLESEEGYQCWISTNDCDLESLYDCCTKRSEDSSYNTRQWYEGEPVKCTSKSLGSAQWLPDNHKPPESVLRKLKSSSGRMKFKVLKVEPESITVNWIVAISGPHARVNPPPSKITGQDLEKVRKLDYFEYQMTQIGDRIWVTVQPDDVVVPYSQWTKDLRRELRGVGRCNVVRPQLPNNSDREHGRLQDHDAAAAASATASTSSSVTISMVSSNSAVLTAAEADLNTTPTAKTLGDDNAVGDDWATDDSGDKEDDDEKQTRYTLGDTGDIELLIKQTLGEQNPRRVHHNIHRQQHLGVTTARRIRPPQASGGSTADLVVASSHSRAAKSFSITTTSNNNNRGKPQKQGKKPPAITIPKPAASTTTKPPLAPKVGERFAAEAIIVRSYLDIMWQDGELELGIPATELAYASGDLDDHLFVPGNFVLLRNDDQVVIAGVGGRTWPECGYGVVESVDSANRIAVVAWFEQKTPPPSPPEQQEDRIPRVKSHFIRKDQVSVYDLVAHPDYEYSPGVLLMKIAANDDDVEAAASADPIPIGQVLYADSNGKVNVKWMTNGQIGTVYPEDVCPIIGEFHDDDSETADGDDDGHGGGSTTNDDDDSESGSASWTTVSMDTSDEEDSDEDCADQETNKRKNIALLLKHSSEAAVMIHSSSRPKNAVELLTKLSSGLNSLRENLLTLRITTDADNAIRRDLASTLIGLHSTLKRVARCWFKLELKSHRNGADLATSARFLREWVKSLDEHERRGERCGTEAVVVHPAKEPQQEESIPTATVTAVDQQQQSEIEAELDSDVSLLRQVEGELRKLAANNNGGSAQEQDNVEDGGNNGAAAAAAVGGLMAMMRKSLRTFVNQIQNHTTTATNSPASGWANSRWQVVCAARVASGSRGGSDDEKQKVTALQRILERGLLEGRPDSDSAAMSVIENNDGSGGATTIFRSLVNDCAVVSVPETDPKHKPTLAAVDLCAAVVLMIIKAMLEELAALAADDGHGQEMTTSRKEWPKNGVGRPVEVEKSEVDGSAGGSGIPPLEENVAREEQSTEQNNDQQAEENQQKHQEQVQEQEQEKQPDEEENTTEKSETPVATSEAAISEERCFELQERAPSYHQFIVTKFDASNVQAKFLKAVRQEVKLLRNSLPRGVFVKAFEDRMDLYSFMLVGPAGTPYTDGLFFFDARLKPSYPTDPPVFHFKSYSTEQLNPNLYQDGKVCVSLLGTWSGKDSEVWNPGSNLLQVLVSIQGLILNAEPYFNEAGYESKRAHPESAEKSRRYNELALIRSVESLWKIASNPPSAFEHDVRRHLAERGRKLIETVDTWIGGTTSCDFPLQPASQGFALSARKHLAKLDLALTSLGF